MKTECIECLNNNCYIKQHCSVDWIQLIGLHTKQSLYKKGECIITEGMPVPGLHFILKGRVKMTSSGLNGKQQILRFVGDGDVMGNYCNREEPVPIGAFAMEDVKICFIDSNVIEDILMSNPLLTIALMRYYSSELRKTESRIKQIVQMNTREKVAEALLFIIDSWGLEDEKDINIQISRQEIADIVGINSEQVVRQLSDFEKENMIIKQGREIEIKNKRSLRNIIRNYKKNNVSEVFKLG
jgi:CRP/FNR family transcriptional regulator, cyclic AMP receptor protein